MIKEYHKQAKDQLSEHFNVSEFKCKCNYPECTITYLDDDLIEYLEKKRQLLEKPIHINSGFRCTRHNRDVGGVVPNEQGKKGSIHLTGKAADISLNGEDITKHSDLFQDADGLGIYRQKNFLHVDVRGYKARWNG